MTVPHISSSALHLKNGTRRSKYMSLGIERRGSICSKLIWLYLLEVFDDAVRHILCGPFIIKLFLYCMRQTDTS